MENTSVVKKTAEKILRSDGPLPFGICRFQEVLPCLDCRALSRIPQNAASVLCCLFPYYTGEHPERNISRYAMVTDYHIVAGDYLERFCQELSAQFPENHFAAFSDNSPIREVTAAFRSGLGRIGNNGLLIHPEYGSYVFIGEVVTDLELIPDDPLTPTGCMNCGLCMKACPQGALQPNGSVCLELCRSHITQKKGELTEQEIVQIKAGGLIWGCDICNDVCPHNREAKKLTPIREFVESAVPVFDQENAALLFKSRAFNYRGKKTIARNISLLEEE